MYQWNRVLMTIYVTSIILCDNILVYGFCLYTGNVFVWKLLLFFAAIVTAAFKMKPVGTEIAQNHNRFEMLY